MWATFAEIFVILVSSTKCNDIDVFSLAGIDEGQDKSYLKWNPAPGRQNFDALSLCMRWRKHRWKWFNAFEFDLWEDNCRFNPHLISESGRKPKSEEMVLASVMNDVGNGNKDEVIILPEIINLISSFFQFFFLSFSPLTSGRKDKNGRPYGNILATTRGNNCNVRILKNQEAWTISGVKYFGGGPVERVPFFWYNMCFTVAYVQGVGAVRLVMRTKKSPKYKISFVGGYMSMAS